MHYAGKAYIFSGGLWICVYRPKADLHFPLALGEESPWRLLNWSIVKSPESNDLIYIIILASKKLEHASMPIDGMSVVVESQFGRRLIAISSETSLDDIDPYLKKAFCSALLTCLAREPEQILSSVLQHIVHALDFKWSNNPPLHAKTAGAENGISLEGIYDARYIVSFIGNQVRTATVKSISFDCVDGVRTILKTEDEVAKGHILLLSDAEYKFAELG